MNLKKIYNASNRTPPRFDGFEKDLENFEFTVKTNASCYLHIPKGFYKEKKANNFLDELATAEREHIISLFRLQSHQWKGIAYYQTYWDLSPYFLTLSSDSCNGRNFLVCLGMSEVQPARYMVFLQAIYEII
jgi:hypothetical protein